MMCWHERYLRTGDNLHRMLLQREIVDGREQPKSIEVLLNRPQGLGNYVPQCLYVHVSVDVDRSELGNSKDSVVRLTRERMTCSICHSGRRVEVTAQQAPDKKCPHIAHIYSVAAHPGEDEDRRCIEHFVSQMDTASYQTPAFDVAKLDRLFFPGDTKSANSSHRMH